jgi:putative ABC transport system permease protein
MSGEDERPGGGSGPTFGGDEARPGNSDGADTRSDRLGVLARFPSVLMAGRNLSRNRLRSALAALGIVIGVLAIATLGIFGNVLQLSATSELGGIGNQVIVSPNEDTGRETLSPRDVAAVERIAEGRGTAVPLVTDGAVVNGPNGQTFAQLYGIDRPGALFEAEAGRMPEFHRQGALVGISVANRLGVGPGSAVEVEGQRFRVIAVLAESEDITPVQPSNAVVLPRDAFAQDAPSQIVVQADSGEDASFVARTVRERLNAREPRVSVFELSSILDRINEFFGLLNGFLIALGAVSLIVAGVAIFNVMLMSTTERRGEIGVLRAVGVQKGDVLRTLVVEAALLGVVGGFGGVLLTGVAVGALYQFSPLGLDVVLDPSNATYLVVAFAFGVFISLVSGLYPAYRAANEEPVDALRD